MKRRLGEEGFTLIEMMIVLLVISVLILIAIPNVTKHSGMIDEKGCQAYIKMVEGQVEAYKIDFKEKPTIYKLHQSNYVKGTVEKDTGVLKLYCPNGEELEIVDGEVKLAKEIPSNEGT